MPEWEYYGSASVLKVYSFPGQKQATWESTGILVSTLSWSCFLALELHPYAGALSSLGLVCSKPWVLSAGVVLLLAGACPPPGRSLSSCPSALSAVPWGSEAVGSTFPLFPESAASAPCIGRGERL